MNAAGGQVVIVDTNSPNVDWPNLEFLSTTAGIPVALPTTADQTATEREPFSVTLPAATDGALPYAYAATGLPDGLTFNASTRVLSGTPTEFGAFTITYTVSDLYGRTASDTFALAVAEAPTKAADTAGSTDLTYREDTAHRAFEGIDAAVPNGGAPEWEHTSGDGLSGTLGTIGTTFTVAGFLRRKDGAPGLCNAWRAGADTRSLRVAADGTIALRWGGHTLSSTTGTLLDDTWHHVAATNGSIGGLRLWVDGVVVASNTVTTTTLSSRPWQMARSIGNSRADIALDEWGIWDAEIDVADLYARARYRRRFGGHIVSTADTTSVGAADIHVFKLTVSDYGFALANARTGGVFIAEGSRRAIVADALQQAGAVGFTTGGIADADMGDILRRVHGADQSAFGIIWDLRSRTKLLTIDPWREIGIRWIDRAEDSGVTLDQTTRAAFALVSESSRYATRALVVAPGRRTENVRLQDGDTFIPLSDSPVSVESIAVNGTAETVADWEVDGAGARVIPPNESPTLEAGIATVVYIGATSTAVTVGDEAADVHTTHTLETDAPNVDIARALGGAYLAQQVARQRYQAITIPSRVEHLAEGQRVTVEADKYSLDQPMIVRRLTEALRSSSARYHGVTFTAELASLEIPLLRLGTGEIDGSVVG